MARILDLAYRLQKRLWRLIRPRTRGVKLMLFDADGHILLIRNTYGRSDLFVLPGGGVHPWETPERAAARETREETGCAVAELNLASLHASTAEGKRDTIYLFKGRVLGSPRPDGVEVVEAAFFAPEKLPASVSPATRRRIEEHLGLRRADGGW